MLTRCPVSYLSEDTEAPLTLFDQCYRLESDGWGHVTWVRTALPLAGGVLDQPAKLMAALSWIERWQNDELRVAIQDARRHRREVGSHDDGR